MVTSGSLLTFPIWIDIARAAIFDPASRYALAVPLVAAWLAHVRRKRLQMCRPIGAWVGPVILTIGLLTFLNSSESQHTILWHGSAVLILLGCFISVVGREVVLRFLPAAVVLVFLIPMPPSYAHTVGTPIQIVVAQSAATMLQAAGQSASFHHETIALGGEAINIIALADSLPMVLTVLLVAYGFVFGLALRTSVRLVILAVAGPLAIGCHAVGVAVAGLLVITTGTDQAGEFVRPSAWLMFPVAIVLIIGLMRLLVWASVPVRRYTLAYDA